ncbi:hypothetical protein Lser_V15G24124 [Lactuca serriola]
MRILQRHSHFEFYNKMTLQFYDFWVVIVKDLKYKVNENQFYGLVLNRLISKETLISYGGLKDDHGRLIFQPLLKIECLYDLFIMKLVASDNRKEGEERDLYNKRYISLVENPSDLQALKFVEDVLDDDHHVLDVQEKGIHCDVLDVLDVQEKGVQVDSHDEKVFCSIGVQTDDILCSCDSFEGMIPYRKPVIQEIHKYQTPKDLIQTQNVHVVESRFVHGVKSSRCKKMRKKRKKKINRKNKRVYSQKSSNVVKPKSVKQIWVPKQQSPNVALNLKSKPKCGGGSFEDVLGSLKTTKNKLYISHNGWYNVQIGDFLIPTKEPRSSKFDSFIANGSRFVKKVDGCCLRTN